MPLYEYECTTCGSFETIAVIAQFDQSQPCPDCGDQAPRTLLSAPMLALMGEAQRNAHVTNERSASAPETSRRTGKHPAACGCCKPLVPTAKKPVPGNRPWMIGH